MSLLSSIKGAFATGDAIATPVCAPAFVASTSGGLPDAQMTVANKAVGFSRQVLFVVGDAGTKQRLEQSLQHLQQRWRISITVHGSGTPELLSSTAEVVAVVADMKLPVGNGIELLTEVARLSPRALRFLRCEAADLKALNDHAGPAMQSIPLDADVEAIEVHLERALLIDSWMSNESLKALVSRMKKLPSLPTLYTQVITELQKPDGSIEFVARLIATDPMMTAKILQVVNSPFFGVTSEITDPGAAVMFLGTERTKSLVLMAKVFSQFDKTLCAGFSLDLLWRHCMGVGACARSLVMAETKDTRLADMAFTAGLLHDVGKLLLAANLPEEYSNLLAQSERRNVAERQVEQEALGATHAELGACLLGMWGLPLPILRAVGWHHTPALAEDTSFSLLTAVHVSNALDYEKKSAAGAPPKTSLDPDYLDQLGLKSKRNAWRKICGCPPKVDAR
jgi:HD-like signal output (HDOD) protein